MWGGADFKSAAGVRLKLPSAFACSIEFVPGAGTRLSIFKSAPSVNFPAWPFWMLSSSTWTLLNSVVSCSPFAFVSTVRIVALFNAIFLISSFGGAEGLDGAGVGFAG